MEWFDYEPLVKLDKVNSEEQDNNNNDNDDASSTFSEKEEEQAQQQDLPTEALDSEENLNVETGQSLDQRTLDDIFESLAVDTSSEGRDHFCDDDQTQSTAKSRRSAPQSIRSSSSHGSISLAEKWESSSRGSISLTEKLEKICDDKDNDKDDGDKSVSAASWFNWRRPTAESNQKIENDSGDENSKTNMDEKSNQELAKTLDDDSGSGDGHGDEVSDTKDVCSKSGTQTTEGNTSASPLEEDPFGFVEEIEHDALLKEFQLESNDGLDLEDPLHKSRDLDKNDLTARNEAGEEHPNQALFDIIEQGFDSIKPLRVKGLERPLKFTEVKLCFAAYVFVFTPPKPTPFALQFNHDIDKSLREEQLQRQGQKGKKKGWFKWGTASDAEDGSRDTSKKNSRNEEDEKYAYEIVPTSVVFSLWTVVLQHVGVKLSQLSPDGRNATLEYLKESLVQVGLLDSSIIDLSRERDGFDDDSQLCEVQECEYIAAHHAINGQYGKYLRRSYTNIKECLERNEKSIFSAASRISNEGALSMRDYCVGMLPYTLSRAQQFERAESLLFEASFVHRRIGYFGILEGTTIQVTDIELVIEQKRSVQSQNNDFNVDALMRNAYGIVKKFIVQNMDQGGENEYEEAGKAFHLLGVSFIAQGMDKEGLECLTEAFHFKKRASALEGEPFSVTLSDSLHCMGLAYGDSGDFDKALSNYKHALSIRRELLGDDDLRVAQTCASMVSSIFNSFIGQISMSG